MKAVVRGYRDNGGGNFREVVFYKRCSNLEEVDRAVEDAFFNGAEVVVIERAK